MSHSWPRNVHFSHQILTLQDRLCTACGGGTHVRDFKDRRLFTLSGPLLLQNQMASCIDRRCPGSRKLKTAKEEILIAPPRWTLAWDAFAYIGQRRFARHWSVPEIREDLQESFSIDLSEDAIEDYIGRYQAILAARQRDPVQLEKAYRSIKKVILSIDGLQPEKGHEALYTVRELNAKRVWFASPLISASQAEVKKLLVEAKNWAERLGKPIEAWVSDKQDAFVKGIAAVFPGVPHRYCQNHFLRDVAEPVLELDSHAKVQMRSKVRGLREIEADILRLPEKDRGDKEKLVLEYCSATRGLLNRNQSGPLDPPGLRMAHGLKVIRASIQRSLEAQPEGFVRKGLQRLASCIDRGIAQVAEDLERIPHYVQDLREIYDTLNPENGKCKKREERFAVIQDRLEKAEDPIRTKMSGIMARFRPGLFAGGDKLDSLRDNLDLERWFRLPKSHERKIHGRQHAGVRLVQEGPSLVLALDAHQSHPRPFTERELEPYLGALPSHDELEAIERRKTMRRAASRKALPGLLDDLERGMGVSALPRKRRRHRPPHASSG